jgi:predicted phage terminase large subunit-like protein
MITHSERLETRRAIKRLATLLTAIETSISTKKPMAPQVQLILRQLCQTSQIENQYNAIDHLLEEARAAYRVRLVEAAPTSLSCFAEVINPEEPPARHHEWMCDRLHEIADRQTLRALFSMPPGHAKSTYCSVLFPAWYMGGHQNHHYLQGGHSQDFVEKDFGLKVKNIIGGPEYAEVFPDVKISKDSGAAGSWGISGKRGTYKAKGVGQKIAGVRASIAGVDDPYGSREDAESPAIRKKVYDWYMADFTTRLLPNAPMFVVATRWHPLDLCGAIEKMSKEGRGLPYDVVNLPAICEEEGDPLGRAIGEALWPDFYTIDILNNLQETLPARDWNSLYRGRPVDENGGVVKASWFKRYDQLPKNHISEAGVILRQEIKRTTISVDCASKTGERNDYTVITVWIEDTLGRHYLADVVRARMEFTEMCNKIDSTARMWSANLILVEDKGSGTQYIQTRTTGGITPPAPVIAIDVGSASKEFRFDGVTPMIEAGEVLFPERAPWLAVYEEEILGFPGGTAHDDQVDSTSQYLARARSTRRGGTKKLSGVGLATTQQGVRLSGSIGEPASRERMRLAERSGRIG